MKQIFKLFQQIESTTSSNRRVAFIIDFLKNSSEPEKQIAIPLIAGTRLRSITTSNALRKIFLAHYHFPDWLYQESYAAVGDTSELISLLIESHNKSTQSVQKEVSSEKNLTQTAHPAPELSAYFSAHGPAPDNDTSVPHIPALADTTSSAHTLTLGEDGISPLDWLESTLLKGKYKVPLNSLEQRVVAYWKTHSSQEIFIFNKLLVGNLRIGVSRGLFAKALALWANVSNSAAQQFLTRNKFDSTSLESQLSSSSVEDSIYPFCLAYPWADSRNERESDFLIEAKFDGIRAQITTGVDAQIWSRGELDISTTFPEILRTFQKMKSGFTVDGEIVASSEGRILDFNTLQSRLGRKKIDHSTISEFPVSFIAYDMLKVDGNDIRNLTLSERKQYLKQFTHHYQINESPYSFDFNYDDISFLKEHARELKIEGLMYKNKNSLYESGRKKGVWYKDKIEPLSLDAVLVYAQVGTGKRANLFTDYTFAIKEGEKLVTFAKAYSGLDDSEIEKLDRWIRRNTLDKKGPVRILSPQLVFEISFEGISRSKRHKSGIAVRFPRIKRWRHDKSVEEINTLEDAMALLESDGSGNKDFTKTPNSHRPNQVALDALLREEELIGVHKSGTAASERPDYTHLSVSSIDYDNDPLYSNSASINPNSASISGSSPKGQHSKSADGEPSTPTLRFLTRPRTQFVEQILNLRLHSYINSKL